MYEFQYSIFRWHATKIIETQFTLRNLNSFQSFFVSLCDMRLHLPWVKKFLMELEPNVNLKGFSDDWFSYV